MIVLVEGVKILVSKNIKILKNLQNKMIHIDPSALFICLIVNAKRLDGNAKYFGD